MLPRPPRPDAPAEEVARTAAAARDWGALATAARGCLACPELAATRHRTQLAKVGLGERGTPWWEQSDDERRERWESALDELDALD